MEKRTVNNEKERPELRILMLEDVAEDSELAQHELRQDGVVFTARVVDTRESFVKGLQEFSPDIVLADYSLPSFNGLAALAIVR
jgi:CheY-like chemotaxis protein